MWYLLAASLFTLNLNLSSSLSLLTASLIWGLINNTLSFDVLTLFAAIGVSSMIIRGINKKYCCLKYVLEGIHVITAFALMLHLIPGFHNLKVLDSVLAGPHSAPFTLYFNFDKALVPFVLLAATGSLFSTGAPCQSGRVGWIALIFAVPALLLLAVALGGLKIETHLPEWLPQFALANIFFVSLAEEALFRGYLQQRLTQLIHPLAALIITATIFGAMHYAGGILLVIFAGLSGIIYGLAWMWSGKLWIAVLFHFGLNMLHLLFFTYPFYRANVG